MLVIISVGEPIENETVPANPPSEEAVGRVNALAEDHNIEMIGPSPVSP